MGVVRPHELRCLETKQADLDDRPSWVNVHVGLLINEPPGGAEMPFAQSSVAILRTIVVPYHPKV
jgi:hypothetical protein